MELNDRLSVLCQAAELAQKGGVLSLEDAVVTKQAIDGINAMQNVAECVEVLKHVAQMAQAKGVYAFKDSHYIYLALEGLDEALAQIVEQAE